MTLEEELRFAASMVDHETKRLTKAGSGILAVDCAGFAARLRARAGQVRETLDSLGTFAADAIQVGEDGPECRACGYELDNDGNGHSRCAVPVIEDALNALGGSALREGTVGKEPESESRAMPGEGASPRRGETP